MGEVFSKLNASANNCFRLGTEGVGEVWSKRLIEKTPADVLEHYNCWQHIVNIRFLRQKPNVDI